MHRVVLIRGADSVIVEAALIDPVTKAEVAEVDSRWSAEARMLKESAFKRGLTEDLVRSEHDHWNWIKKLRYSGKATRILGISDDIEIQGLMMITLGLPCKLEQELGNNLVYVDYLQVAPWNLAALNLARPYRGIGRAFLLEAIRISREAGFAGRIGLISLLQSVPFYRAFGMVEVGVEYRSTGYRLTRFEITEADADKLTKDII